MCEEQEGNEPCFVFEQQDYRKQENNHPEWPDYTLCLPLIMLSYWSAGLIEEKKRHKLSVAGGVIKNL